MDFNTILLRFGLDSSNFKNKLVEPIPFDGGFIYEVEQEINDRTCPICGNVQTHIQGHYFTKINSSSNNHIMDQLRIRRTELYCPKCKKTFTPPIFGIDKKNKTSNFTKELIMKDFTDKLTFSQIADKYHLSKTGVIKLFDTKVPYVPRRNMPEVLCIDEIKFEEDCLNENKYIAVLVDFNAREIVDIIRSRRMPYLREYFSNISFKEREKTKVFISDMYDAYADIRRIYFPNAIHVVDLFHVITQLTNAVNRIRTRVMNNYCLKGTVEYNFMKKNWRYFLCRKSRVPDKFYTYKKTGEMIHYDEIIRRCLKTDLNLDDAYMCLQELFRYSEYGSYEDALDFVERISKKLIFLPNPLLKAVGRTYHKWRYEIANGFDKKSRDFHYTNAIAEGLNNQLKTITKSAYGYHNFERFRKRAMLILTYSKK
ncbi:MAG: ISL3 family transposase [Bacilli bacterium]|nr:ISL3 family transposase [Bacilli bacterium]